MKIRRVAAVVLAGGVITLVVAATRHGGHAPVFPRFRRHVREDLHTAVVQATHLDPRGMHLVAAREPMPAITPPSGDAYRSAIAMGDGHPGATSFRADADAYCDYNRDALEEQARKEGITTGEVRELTFFGFAAMRTTQVGTVEKALGRKLTADETQALTRILDDENRDFTASMRKLVDDGASEEERWDAIRAFEQDYMNQFATQLGVTPAQFDQMLAPEGPAVSGDPTSLPASAWSPEPAPQGTPAPADPNGTPKPAPGPKSRPTPLPGHK